MSEDLFVAAMGTPHAILPVWRMTLAPITFLVPFAGEILFLFLLA